MVAAVVLAAGASTRFGSPKQQILLEPVLERLRATTVDDIVVVLGAHSVETTARTVVCGAWERGPGASLRCGLAALAPAVEAAVVVLADGPDLAPAAVDRVVAAWRESDAEVVVATYGGARSHPVLVARGAWGRIPDEGARNLEALAVPCDDLGSPGDVDFAHQLPGRFKPKAAELNSADADDRRASSQCSAPELAELAPSERPPAAEADPRGSGKAR